MKGCDANCEVCHCKFLKIPIPSRRTKSTVHFNVSIGTTSRLNKGQINELQDLIFSFLVDNDYKIDGMPKVTKVNVEFVQKGSGNG